MKKGILFSLIVLILLLNLIALKTVSTGSKGIVAGNSVELLAFNAIDQRFDDIQMNMVKFSGFGQGENVKERILPFSFALDENSFSARQEIPLSQSKINIFFDAINSFEIWQEDTDYANFFSGLVVDANTAKNTVWGGTGNSAEFYILPQCLKYKVFDTNKAGFEAGSGCEAAFSENNVARYDVNILLDVTADFNAVSCSFDSIPGCPADTFDPLNPNPFIQVNILDQNCSACAFDQSEKTISSHFNPLAQNSIVIECVGAGCATPDMNISFSDTPTVSFTGPKQVMELEATFKQQIGEFSFLDFNFSVENPALMLKKYSG